MSTQIVGRSERAESYTVNFPANNTTLSWPFENITAGVIYKIDSVNVESFTLRGTPITLPYAVQQNTQYGVSIVKTNP